MIQCKGLDYTVRGLLADSGRGARVRRRRLRDVYWRRATTTASTRRSTGSITGYRHIPGAFFPVNPLSVRNVAGLFSINERLVTYLDSEFGRVAVVKVAATGVGHITLSYDRDVRTPPHGKAGRHGWAQSTRAAPGRRAAASSACSTSGSTVICCSSRGAWCSTGEDGRARCASACASAPRRARPRVGGVVKRGALAALSQGTKRPAEAARSTSPKESCRRWTPTWPAAKRHPATARAASASAACCACLPTRCSARRKTRRRAAPSAPSRRCRRSATRPPTSWSSTRSRTAASADGLVPAATDFLAAVDGEAGLNMQVRILEADAEDEYDDEGAEPEIRVEEADTDPKTIVGMSSDGVPQIVEDVPTSPLPTRPAEPGLAAGGAGARGVAKSAARDSPVDGLQSASVGHLRRRRAAVEVGAAARSALRLVDRRR